MRILIPSRARYSSTALTRGTLADLGPELRAQTVLFVRSEEADAYGRGLRNAGYELEDVVIVSTEYEGIGWKRYQMAHWAAGRGDEHFLMCDDDLDMNVRRSDDVYNLRRTVPADLPAMMTALEWGLQSYAAVGISAREGNNRSGPGSWRADNMVVPATRLMRAVAFRTEDFLRCEHGRLPVMEDFDVQLQLLRRGLGTACLYYWAQGQGQTNAPGGCSVWRTHAIHEEGARRLAELHPGYVKLRQKSNKTDREGLGTRTEVTISWQKAAAARDLV